MNKLLISACLLGDPVRYDATRKHNIMRGLPNWSHRIA